MLFATMDCDYYETLEIKRNATHADITQAYVTVEALHLYFVLFVHLIYTVTSLFLT